MLPTTRHNAFLGVEHLSSQSLMFTQWQNIAFVGSNTLVIQTQEQLKSQEQVVNYTSVVSIFTRYNIVTELPYRWAAL